MAIKQDQHSASSDRRLGKITHDLVERIKELNCLYGISRLVEKSNGSLEEIMDGVVNLIPPAWQYPEVTCARISIKDGVFQTPNFKETVWKQAEPIIVGGKPSGLIEVFYLEKKPHSFEGPFLREERDLIHGIAERLGHIIDSKIAEESLKALYARERKLHQKLRDEMQRRVDFTRLIVHELKTPLTSLMATSQLLLEETSQTRLEKVARYVWDGANAMNLRIEELHDIIRGEIGNLKLHIKPFDIGKLLHLLVGESRALAQQQGVEITLEVPDDLPEVHADDERVRQIMHNLMNNVFKYAGDGGKMTIRARNSGDGFLVVEVQDFGPGISKERQRLLFKIGHRETWRAEGAAGLGIGLALCKLLVELQGGKIWLESRAGKGSSFFFSLPVFS